MAQFDVFRNPRDVNGEIPYLLDVQSELLGDLPTRVVIPLVRPGHFTPPQRLNPTFAVGDQEVTMSTAEIAGIPRTAMGERVGSLDHHRAEIIGAIDLLISGV